MATPAVTEPVQQTTTRKRGRYARQKNQNMTRNADQSTWLRFCKKYRAEITNKQGKDYFKTIKLPDKTRHMAKAYQHFKSVKGLAVAPPKQKEVDSEYNKYVTELKAAIDSATFTFSDAGNADSHGFLMVDKKK
jgi:hypothetical protein